MIWGLFGILKSKAFSFSLCRKWQQAQWSETQQQSAWWESLLNHNDKAFLQKLILSLILLSLSYTQKTVVFYYARLYICSMCSGHGTCNLFLLAFFFLLKLMLRKRFIPRNLKTTVTSTPTAKWKLEGFTPTSHAENWPQTHCTHLGWTETPTAALIS